MSYEIVYERQFVKVPLPNCDEPWILPLTLHGSNNCTEMTYNGRERRERHWSGIYFNGGNQLPVEAPAVMMKKIESFCGGAYQEHFKRNGKWVDDAGLIRFFNNGIKNAKTIEELNELSRYPVELNGYLSIWVGSDNKREMMKSIRSSAELVQFILDAKVRIMNRADNEQIYVCIAFTGEKAVPYPKEVMKRAVKEYENEYWVLDCKYHGDNIFIEKLTARHLTYTRSPERARKFETEKEALKWIETKLRTKGFNQRVIDTLVPVKMTK